MTGNVMQRVFDALVAAGEPITMAELCERLVLDRQSVRGAMRYLAAQGFVVAQGRHNARRYAPAPGACRPEDRRGGSKRKS